MSEKTGLVDWILKVLAPGEVSTNVNDRWRQMMVPAPKETMLETAVLGRVMLRLLPKGTVWM